MINAGQSAIERIDPLDESGIDLRRRFFKEIFMNVLLIGLLRTDIKDPRAQ